MTDALKPDTETLMAIGSALVHADEYLGPNGHPLDLEAFRALMAQEKVQSWLRDMGPLLPLRRS